MREPVRIDYSKAIAGVKVGDDHVADQSTLAGAALAEKCRVFAANLPSYRDDGIVSVSAEEYLHEYIVSPIPTVTYTYVDCS